MTLQTRDGGKDIIVRYTNDFGEDVIYIECKHSPKKKKIGAGVIRKLVGVMNLDNVTKAVIYTSSFFSKVAKDLAEKVKNRITLFDRHDLLADIDKIMSMA